MLRALPIEANGRNNRALAAQLRAAGAGHVDEDAVSVGSSQLDEAVRMLEAFASGHRAMGEEAERAILDFVTEAAGQAN